jgi:lipopolysaccharide/colanic/teichoic acid biosynthesis glycosyltransferase
MFAYKTHRKSFRRPRASHLFCIMSASPIFQQDFSTLPVPANLVYPDSQHFVDAGDELLIAAESLHLHQLSLDFTHTTLVDSSGIGALKHLAQTAKGYGLSLTCQHVQSPLQLALIDVIPDLQFLVEVSNCRLVAALGRHASVSSVGKRLLDILGAIVGLVLTGLLLIPLAILIKRDSPGPIFFAQTRVGVMGRPFRMWKFRSMIANAEALKSQIENQIEADGKFFKNANDPRRTRVGQFLRRTSLDEFPQFWNVLRGEMSLVGTRPPTPDEVENYTMYEWQRLNVKPGITGEWQANGRSTIESFREVVELDLQYQQRWSLGYDLHLIAKTIWVLLFKQQDAC